METEDGLNRRPQSGAIAIAVYCAFQSSHLVAAWRHSPFDRWSWIALLIWLAPLGAVWTRTPAEFRLGRLNHWLLGLALLVSLLGTVTSMNAIKYVALAISVLGMIRWRWTHLVWFAGAAAWMPAFGYFAAGFIRTGPPVDLILMLALRVSVVTAVIFCLWKLRRKATV